MSETLNKVTNYYISTKHDRVFKTDIGDIPPAEYENALKKDLINRIYDEISEEIYDDVVNEANKSIEKIETIKKIQEYKKITVEGFLVAFFVGLLVNQVTDVIGYFKGTVQVSDIWPTIVISVILLIVCTGFFIFMFLSEIIKLLKEV